MDWIEMVRNGGDILRYHTVRTIGSETVGKHSFSVAAICCALCEPSVELLKRALFHDLSEQSTGDVPAPVKWANPELKQTLVDIEEQFDHTNGVAHDLSEDEELVLKWADMLDLCFYCTEQKELGNTNLEPLFLRGSNYLRSLPVNDNGMKLLRKLEERHG